MELTCEVQLALHGAVLGLQQGCLQIAPWLHHAHAARNARQILLRRAAEYGENGRVVATSAHQHWRLSQRAGGLATFGGPPALIVHFGAVAQQRAAKTTSTGYFGAPVRIHRFISRIWLCWGLPPGFALVLYFDSLPLLEACCRRVAGACGRRVAGVWFRLIRWVNPPGLGCEGVG